jgi:hypothetical protein
VALKPGNISNALMMTVVFPTPGRPVSRMFFFRITFADKATCSV